MGNNFFNAFLTYIFQLSVINLNEAPICSIGTSILYFMKSLNNLYYKQLTEIRKKSVKTDS